MSFGAFVAFGVAAVLQAIVALLVLEGYLLITNQEPITWWTRRAEWAFPGPAVFVAGLVMFAIGTLFAHFVWDAGKDKPPSERQ